MRSQTARLSRKDVAFIHSPSLAQHGKAFKCGARQSHFFVANVYVSFLTGAPASQVNGAVGMVTFGTRQRGVRAYCIYTGAPFSCLRSVSSCHQAAGDPYTECQSPERIAESFVSRR